MEHNGMGAFAALGVAALVGIGAVTTVGFGSGGATKVTVRDVTGEARGTVSFSDHGHHGTEIRVRLRGLPDSVARDAFHGFHIHANADATNGEGCLADATKPSSTWFVAVDGHWKADGQVHANHLGDLASVFVTGDGTAEARFVTDRIEPGDLRGKAVVIHAGPDNFGNVPVGNAANQYTANQPDAVTATQNTGNAGDRILCGVIGGRR